MGMLILSILGILIVLSIGKVYFVKQAKLTGGKSWLFQLVLSELVGTTILTAAMILIFDTLIDERGPTQWDSLFRFRSLIVFSFSFWLANRRLQQNLLQIRQYRQSISKGKAM